MLDLKICPACGERGDHPVPDPESARLRCLRCGHRWPFQRLPLFALTGPSGGGKSTVGPRLAERLAGRAVVLEQDVLWIDALREPDDQGHGHPRFRSVWLRMAAMIAQSGLPVVLCGTVVPAEFERLPERALFDRIHYLAMIAEDAVLAERLRGRPAWRQWDEPRIAEMLEFAGWLRRDGAAMTPPIRLVDTTDASREAAVDAAVDWVTERLPG